jgi:hypothetical protein
MKIRQVTSTADLRRFAELPYGLYRDDPVWAPPLRAEQKKQYDPAETRCSTTAPSTVSFSRTTCA